MPAALAVLLLCPGPAGALSISVGTPPGQMTFSPSTNGTTSMTVTVVALVTYTMSISSQDGTPGFMDRVDCGTRAALGGSLQNRLAWSSPTTGASGQLSGTPQNVASGLLLGSVAISFVQDIGAAESVSQGACYEEPVTITVT